MLSMTREGPYLIFGNKGKLVAWTLHRFYVLKLTHPLLYDDDTITHAANDIKRIFLIVESKILDGRSWSYLDIELCTISTLKRYNLHLDWWYFLRCGNDFWRIYTDFWVQIWQVKVKLRVLKVATDDFVSVG